MSVFFGTKIPEGSRGRAGHVPPGVIASPLEERAPASEQPELKEYGRWGPIPGTVVLVAIFLVAFITYYFANWKLLSFVWQIG